MAIFFIWKSHIQLLSSKLAKSVGILNLARKTFTKGTLIKLYYAFIYPLLLYGNIIWGNAPKSTLWPIYKIQKCAIRLITNKNRRDSTNSSFIDLKMLKLPDIYDLSTGVFMWNFTHSKVPPIMSNFFTHAHNVHDHSTRNELIFRYPKYTNNLGQNFIRKTGIDIWRKVLKSSGKSPVTISGVKRILIEDALKRYNLTHSMAK